MTELTTTALDWKRGALRLWVVVSALWCCVAFSFGFWQYQQVSQGHKLALAPPCSNVGEDKDTLKRQREAVEGFAKRADYEIIAEYRDDAVKGSDPVDQRPGFADMLRHIASNGVRTIIVETANRFARDLITQETGWRFLRDAEITLIAADSPDAFLDATPTAVMIRQILGSVAQFEKAMLVAKLRGARERKKAITGKCGGRKNYTEINPEAVALAKRLHRYSTNGRKRSLRDVAAELEAAGHVTRTGRQYAANAIAKMIAR